MNKSLLQLGFLACLLACFGAANAQPQKIVGDVVGFDAPTLQIKANDGQAMAVKIGDSTRLSARSGAALDQIVAGAFIGTTAVPQPDGTLSAVEVHIFPESMRGSGEGHRPMDTLPGSTMTNATVSSVGRADPAASARSTTTNATVAQREGTTQSLRLTLTYKGGEKVVTVPAGIPIVMVEPADRSLLAPGAHVIVYASRQPDGSLTADRLTVGKNGFVPPM
jgi:hypothetical protein